MTDSPNGPNFSFYFLFSGGKKCYTWNCAHGDYIVKICSIPNIFMRNLDIPGKGEVQRNPLVPVYTANRRMQAANKIQV